MGGRLERIVVIFVASTFVGAAVTFAVEKVSQRYLPRSTFLAIPLTAVVTVEALISYLACGIRECHESVGKVIDAAVDSVNAIENTAIKESLGQIAPQEDATTTTVYSPPLRSASLPAPQPSLSVPASSESELHHQHQQPRQPHQPHQIYRTAVSPELNPEFRAEMAELCEDIWGQEEEKEKDEQGQNADVDWVNIFFG